MAKKSNIGGWVVGISSIVGVWWIYEQYRAGRIAAAQQAGSGVVGGTYAGGYNPYNPYGASATTSAQQAGQPSGNILSALFNLLGNAIQKAGGNISVGGPNTSFNSKTANGVASGLPQTIQQIAQSIGLFNSNAINTPIPDLGGQSLATYDPTIGQALGALPGDTNQIPLDQTQSFDLSGMATPIDLSSLSGINNSITTSSDIASGGIDLMPITPFDFGGGRPGGFGASSLDGNIN